MMASKLNDFFEGADITLEDVLNKTRDAAEVIGKKSAERLELSRKKVEYFDTKSKLNRQYEKYGRMSYKVLLGEEVDDYEMSECAAKISQLKDKLDLLSVDIENAKEQFNEAVSAATQKAQKAYEDIKKEVEKVNQKSDAEIEVEAEQAAETAE
ncbi:MAG: hypothetical protein IJ851_00310 [Eubacterium sp.]|nr:hypothetical protein [Eubacterium sp.]